MYQQLFEIIAPVVIAAGAGFVWKRSGRPFDTGMLTAIVANVAVPCLILASLTKLTVDARSFGIMALGATLAIAFNMSLGALLLRLLRLPGHTFLPALAIGNSGNLGLPLCFFAFGEPGLALALGVFTIHSVFQFTLGPLIASGRFAPASLLRSPFPYVLIVAVALMLAQLRPPAWALNGLSLLGGMAIPMMLMALGVSLAGLRIATLALSGGLAALRLAIGFGTGLALVEILGLSGAERGVLIIQCAMPAAVFTYLWAQIHGRDAGAVGSIVVLSTFLSLATFPAVLAVALDESLLGV